MSGNEPDPAADSELDSETALTSSPLLDSTFTLLADTNFEKVPSNFLTSSLAHTFETDAPKSAVAINAYTNGRNDCIGSTILVKVHYTSE